MPTPPPKAPPETYHNQESHPVRGLWQENPDKMSNSESLQGTSHHFNFHPRERYTIWITRLSHRRAQCPDDDAVRTHAAARRE